MIALPNQQAPDLILGSLLKNLSTASHPERSAAMGVGGAARSRRIGRGRQGCPKQAAISFREELACQFHGIPSASSGQALRLRYARLPASVPLRMTPNWRLFNRLLGTTVTIIRPTFPRQLALPFYVMSRKRQSRTSRLSSQLTPAIKLSARSNSLAITGSESSWLGVSSLPRRASRSSASIAPLPSHQPTCLSISRS